MSGAAIVGALLRANSNLTTVVSGRIFNGLAPINVTLPAVSIFEIDAVDTRTVRMSETPLIRSRVQVMVMAKSYAVQKQVLELVRKALPHTRGTVGSYSVDSILPEFAGPDQQEPDTGTYSQSRDFLVTFVAP